MTIAEARARVDEIRAIAEDDEAAHSKEDDLHVAALRQVAEARTAWERDNAALVASIALETVAIKFARWCA
jgi:hypothetical protein